MQKVCKICGRLFETETKALVCSDECRRQAKLKSQRLYMAKQKMTAENKIKAKQPTATRIIRTTKIENQSDIVIETLEKSILDNLELLDELRNELSKLANELKAKQSAYDSKDFEILHLLEGATTDNALLQYAKLAKENRKGRRDYKNYIIFLSNILKGLPINTKQAFEKAKETQNYKNIYYSIKY